MTTAPFIRYGRISKLDGRIAGDSASRREQDRETIAIARRYDLATFPEMIFDEDESGATFERPGWERARRLVKDGEAGGIIAYDLKRMSRNKTAETLIMIEDVEDAGGMLYDGSGLLSVARPDDEMMTTLKAMMARRDWREKQDYMRASVRDAILRGVHLRVPFGYQRSEGRDGVRKGTPLEPHPVEERIVCLAFELRAQGVGWVAIAKRLNEEGVYPRVQNLKKRKAAGPPRWTHTSVAKMVANEVYTGVAFHGEHRTEGAHPALVSRALYDAANRSRGTKHWGPSEGYLLTGLVRCTSCGFVAPHARRKKRHDAYACRNVNCTAPAHINAELLDRWVDAQMVEEIEALRSFQPTLDDSALLAAEQRVAEAERELEGAFATKARMGKLSKAEQRIVERQLDDARATLRAAEVDRDRERNKVRGIDLPPGLTADGYLAMPIPEKRHLLALVFAGVAVRKVGRVQVIDELVARMVMRDEPGDGEIIPFFAALDWEPAQAGVASAEVVGVSALDVVE